MTHIPNDKQNNIFSQNCQKNLQNGTFSFFLLNKHLMLATFKKVVTEDHHNILRSLEN